MNSPETNPDSSARRIDRFLSLMRLDDDDRERELERIRREDPAAGAALDDLLAHEAAARAEGFLESAPPGIDEPPPGTFIGPYLLVRPLGRGGMGIVYLAERVEPYPQKVAIKRMRMGLPSRFTARFDAERRILATLTHPGIVRLLDGGTWPDGSPYYVMEYVAGDRLDEHCEGRNLGRTERVRLVLATAEAVAFAHERGIVHRDLKPSNILVDDQGGPRVTDFGLAKLVSNTGGGDRTESNLLLGTPSYMAPERLTLGPGRDEPGVDVYSLGVILFALVAKRPPFESNAGIEGVPPLREDAPPLRRIDKSIPRDLETIVARALARDPRERFADAGELAEQLRRHLDGRPLTIRPPTPAVRLGKWAGRHRKAILAWCATFAILSLAMIGFLLRWNESLRRDQDAIRLSIQAMWAASTRLFESLPREDPAVLKYHGDLARSFEKARAQGLFRDDPSLDRQGGVLLRQYGAALEAGGKPTEALPLLDRSIQLLVPLPARALNPREREWIEFDLFRSLAGRAGVLEKLGRSNDARTDAAAALDLVTGLTVRSPRDPAWWEARARHLLNLARILRRLSRNEEADAADRNALASASRSVELAGEDVDLVKLNTQFWAAFAAAKTRSTHAEAERYLWECHAIAERARRRFDAPNANEMLLVSAFRLALNLQAQGRLAEAEPNLRRTIEILGPDPQISFTPDQFVEYENLIKLLEESRSAGTKR